MSVETEVFRMLYEIDPSGSMARARAEVDKYEKRLEAIKTAGTSFGATHQQIEDRLRKTTALYQEATRKVELLEAASRGASTGAANSAAKIQQVGWALQDLTQGGLGAIINNVDGLARSFGLGAGLAGGAQIAAAMLAPLLPMLKELWAGLRDNPAALFADGLKRINEELEKLAENPPKLAVDVRPLEAAREQLERLKEGLEAFNRLADAQTSTQEKIGRGVKEAITEHAGATDFESGADNLAQALLDIEMRRPGALDGSAKHSDKRRRLKADLADTQRRLKDPTTDPEMRAMLEGSARNLPAQIQAIEEAIRLERRDEIRGRIGRAAGGFEAERAWLEGQFFGNREVLAARGIGDPFGAAIMGANPEWIKIDAENKKTEAEQKEDARRYERELQEHAARMKARGGDEAAEDREIDTFLNVRDRNRLAAQAQAAGHAGGEADEERGLGAFLDKDAAGKAQAAAALAPVMATLAGFSAALAEAKPRLSPAEFRRAEDRTRYLQERGAYRFLVSEAGGNMDPKEALPLARMAPRVARDDLDERVRSMQANSREFNHRALNNQDATTAVLRQLVVLAQQENARAQRQAADLAQVKAALARIRAEAQQAGDTALNRGRGH